MPETNQTRRPKFIDAHTIASRVKDADAFGARLAGDPGDVLADAQLESIHRASGNWEPLIELLIDRTELVASDAERIEILLEVASIYKTHLASLDSALLVALAAFQIDAGATGVADVLDTLAYQTGQWDDVIDGYMVAAGKLASDSPALAGELWLRIACAHLVTTGDTGAVAEALSRIRRLDSDRVSAYLEMVERRIDSLTMLDTLVELCRRIGDDARRSRCLSRAVAMARDTSTKARYHLAIGDLAESGGDLETARWHYTEALRLDPNRAGAREALVTLYRAEGNQRELAALLASSRFTPSQTANANISLQAASIYADELDENTRAINLYAFALSQDPEHVGAALPLAERYYDEQRWHELGPILDLLIARVDELGPTAPDIAELHYQRAKCAISLGDHAIGRGHCERALAFDSKNIEANRELAVACTELGDHDAACNAYNAVLVLQRESKANAAERSSTLVEMARTRRLAGDDDAALTLYESGLDLAFCRDAFSEVRAIYERKEMWPALIASARVQLERRGLGDKDRGSLLATIAVVLGARLGDAHSAITAFEEAHTIAPDDRSVLHQLIEYYSAAEMWEQAVHSMRKVAALEPGALRRGKYLQAAGTIARHHLDLDRTVTLYSEALDCFFSDSDAAKLPASVRPSCMKAFTDLARALHVAGEHKTLERSYRQMIRRMRAGDPELPELWHGLGQVYRKYLRQTEAAIESFEVASSLDKDRVTHQQILIDLYRNSPVASVDQIDKAIERRQLLISHEPFVADHYRELHSLYRQSSRHDEAYTAARALALLGAADSSMSAGLKRQRAGAASVASGQLSPADWESMRGDEEDATISQIMALVAEAVARDTALPARKLGLRDDPNPLFDHLRRMFVGTAAALGLPTYDLCIQPEIAGDFLLANVRRGRRLAPTFAVGRALYDGQSVESITHTLGRVLTYGRPEYLLRLALPTAADLEAVFLAASSMSRADVPISPALAPLVARYQSTLARRLGPEWKRALAASVDAFVAAGRPFCLETWGHAVDGAARRAGLLLSGDLEVAIAHLGREPRFTAGRSSEEKTAELLIHSVSPTHHRLRVKLGLAIASDDIAVQRRSQR